VHRRILALAVGASCLAAPARAQNCALPSFEGTRDFATLAPPERIVLADLDRDGVLDAAVTGSTAGTVEILLGSGSGFGAPTSIPLAGLGQTVTGYIAAADVNHDGNVDLAVTAFESFFLNDWVFVLLGDGSGGFPVVNRFDRGLGVRIVGPLVLADFDRDGEVDIALNRVSQAETLLGDGTGDFTFLAATPIPDTTDLETGDVDRDGILDLVSLDQLNKDLVVALGDGSGRFGPPATFSTLFNSLGLALADFDEDGILDAVTANTGSNDVRFLKGAGDGTFALTFLSPAGAGAPNGVATGDFDGDGNLDVVVPMNSGTDVSVLLGDGAGFFGAPTLLAAQALPFDAAVGDVNRDGRDDFVVANSGGQSISLLLNEHGSPCPLASFGEVGRVYDVGSDPLNIVIEDFNGDFLPDIATSNRTSNNVTVLLGQGAGRFGAAASFAVSSTPVSLAAADFNSDGNVDLVTGNESSANVSVLFGTGTGSFGGRIDLPLSGSAKRVQVGDFNNDGKADLAVAMFSTNVRVALGNGAGGFSAFTSYAVGTFPNSVSVADFNEDGNADLGVPVGSTNVVSILLGTGTGTFSPATQYPVGTDPQTVAPGDFNEDGHLDLAVALKGMSAVQLLLGAGNGTFGAPATFSLGNGPQSSQAIVAEDFDRDGNLDVAVATFFAFRLDVLRGNGAGSFFTPAWFPTSNQPQAIAAADLDGDGILDLAAPIRTSNHVWIAFGDGTASFGPRERLVLGGSTVSPEVGDLNSDGILDFVVANNNDADVSVVLGTGGGAFGPTTDISVAPRNLPGGVALGDFDRDSDLDMAVTVNSTSALGVFLGNGAGGFGAPTYYAAGSSPGRVLARDLDLDGDLDAVIQRSNNDLVEVLLGDGLGGFGAPTAFAMGDSPSDLVLEDFDRDGNLDVATANFFSDDVTVRLGTGTGSFGPVITVSSGDGAAALAAGDFDEDGVIDLAVSNMLANNIRVLRGTGTGTFVAGPALPAFGDASAVRVLDFNRDGKLDVAAVNRTGHVVSVYAGTGALTFSTPDRFHAGVRIPHQLALGDFDGNGRVDLLVLGYAVPGPSRGAVLFNTSCETRRLYLTTHPSSCDLPGVPFAVQPAVRFEDDGRNLRQCEVGPAVASIVPGTGTAGAILGGTTSVTATSGAASFADLSIDRAGAGYELEIGGASARKARSRSISLALATSITGPSALCQGDSAIYSADPGFETYGWFLDSSPQSMARTVDLTSILTPGLHTLDVDASKDGCIAMASLPIDVTANLGGVGIAPVATYSVCETCTGPNITATPTGGGAVAYQWGYRTVSLGSITPIAGATGASYVIEGDDFGGPGTYFLVVTAFPSCGLDTVSNEIQVDVTVASGPNPLVAITALSTKGQNLLEWASPTSGACTSIRILRRSDGVFPFDPMDLTTNVHVGGADFPCPPSGKDAFADSGLIDDTKYFYSAYVMNGGNFSTRTTVTGRPFDNSTGSVKWAYSTGATSMAPVGVRILGGVASLYVVSNDKLVHALRSGSAPPGGRWLPSAKPAVLGAPSQVRPPVVSFNVGSGPLAGVNGAAFVSSQDGNVYALDADEMDPIWVASAGEELLAGAAGIFAAIGGAPNVVLVGTKNTIAANTLRAFDVEDGAPRWTFDNGVGQGGDGSPIGMIFGGASIDYGGQRAFVGSHKDPVGGQYTIWALDLSGPAPALLWSRDVGDVETAPVYLSMSPPSVVVGTKSGQVHLLDASNAGNPVWSAPYDASDGAVKAYVFPQIHAVPTTTVNFLFSTTNKVTSIRHNGAGNAPTKNWELSAIPFPSTPLFLPGTTSALVGGADGKLHQIDGVDGGGPSTRGVVLGDGLSQVGTPSFDVTTRLIFVGTDEGVIYAVQYPIP
jgi:hypothetical protein